MLIRPTADDIRLIAYNMGRIFLAVAVIGLIPTIWAGLRGEYPAAASFVLMVGAFAFLGSGARFFPPKSHRLEWRHGMVIVALTWAMVPFLATIPFLLSGHWASPLDAYFDAMSGITTTGLALVQDVDHLATSVNFWRHLLQFMGGQGIVLAVLTVFAGGGAMTLYYGEAREEQILPSVRSTARFIWAVSAIHLAFGVLGLWLVGYLLLGFEPFRAFFHGITIFMAAFDTGGFSPMSSSVGYYHSAAFEAITAVLMIAGATSFGLHYALWRGPGRILRNLELRTILATVMGSLFLVLVGLAGAGFFTDLAGLTRQGLFHVLSAHTGTGFSTVPSSELARWGGLAFGGLTIAMALGGMTSSTAGGVKSLRIGLTLKALAAQVRQVLLPEGAVVSHQFWQNGPRQLTTGLTQAVMTVSLLYVGLYVLGAGAGLLYQAPLQEALFESVSAGANVGLSVGLTDPTMPSLLKLTYILQMWAGRLEFVAVFSLLGFLYAWVRGR
ncbi:MAG TPA: potassium transporter TrkG [Acidimicrobiia bacterium]